VKIARQSALLPLRLRFLFFFVILTASATSAQQIWVGDGWLGRTRPKWATASDFDGTFLFCRAFYTTGRYLPSGSGWNTDPGRADSWRP
jgi:hypothetical protein